MVGGGGRADTVGHRDRADQQKVCRLAAGMYGVGELAHPPVRTSGGFTSLSALRKRTDRERCVLVEHPLSRGEPPAHGSRR